MGYLLPLLLITAACSSTNDGRDVASAGGSAVPGATPSLSRLDQLIKYSQCMREHGVPMSDPRADGDGVREGRVDAGFDKGKTDEAIELCKHLRPAMESGPQAELKQELARQFSRCMRENGVENYPDPGPDGRTRVSQEVGEDPQGEEARKVCTARADAAVASARPVK